MVDDGGQLVEVSLALEIGKEMVEFDEGAPTREELLEELAEAVGCFEDNV